MIITNSASKVITQIAYVISTTDLTDLQSDVNAYIDGLQADPDIYYNIDCKPIIYDGAKYIQPIQFSYSEIDTDYALPVA